MWMGEKITEKGIGNGVSLIIFVGIVARLPVTVWSFLQNIFAGEVNAWALVPIVVIYVAIVAGVVFIDCGERRIPGAIRKARGGPPRCMAGRPQHSDEDKQRGRYADHLCGDAAAIPRNDRKLLAAERVCAVVGPLDELRYGMV